MARVDAAPISVVVLTYVVPIEQVDAHMTAHVAWLQRCIDEGVLLISGRQVPRVGGVLIFRGRRAEAEALAMSDPFVTSGVATIAVTEIAAGLVADAIAPLLG